MKRLISLLLFAAMLAALFAGCAAGEPAATAAASTASAAATTAVVSAAAASDTACAAIRARQTTFRAKIHIFAVKYAILPPKVFDFDTAGMLEMAAAGK